MIETGSTMADCLDFGIGSCMTDIPAHYLLLCYLAALYSDVSFERLRLSTVKCAGEPLQNTVKFISANRLGYVDFPCPSKAREVGRKGFDQMPQEGDTLIS